MVDRVEVGPEKEVYFAGEELRGCVQLELGEGHAVSEVLMELKGAAKTYWTKGRGRGRRHWADSEPYISHQINTGFTHDFGAAGEREVPKGRHAVPYAFALPPTLPSSFEGDFGHVRYTLKATVERKGHPDVVALKAISVVGLEDMNADTKAREPVRLEAEEFSVRYCCRARGSISVSLSVPRTGYVPGESLILSASVSNDSPQTIRSAVARIKQHTTYRAKSFRGHEASKEATKVIVSKDKGPVAPFASQEWVGDRLPIPAVAPKLVRCHIVDVSYTLELEVDPGIVVMAPLVIGTIPMWRAELESSERRCPGPLAQLYPRLAPPVYQDSLFGAKTIVEEKEILHFGSRSFTPQYAVFASPSVSPRHTPRHTPDPTPDVSVKAAQE